MLPYSLLFVKCILSFVVMAFAQQTDDPDSCPLQHLCFALDESGSIDNSELTQIRDFTSNVTDIIGSRNPPGILFSLVTFSSRARVIQEPIGDVSEFSSVVSSFDRRSGFTNIQEGLAFCRNFLENQNGRRVITVLTDGAETIGDAVSEAEEIKANGIEIITVGVGGGIDIFLLNDVASPSRDLRASFANSRLVAEALNTSDNACTLPEDLPPPPENPLPALDPPTADDNEACLIRFRDCDLRFTGFQNNIPTFDASRGTPGIDKTFTRRIVYKRGGPRIGVLNSNGITPDIINDDNSVTRITSMGIPHFTATHIKPFPKEGTIGSGIGHQMYIGNQRDVIKGKCVRVFFSQIQILDGSSTPSVIENEVFTRSDKKCVVFMTSI